MINGVEYEQRTLKHTHENIIMELFILHHDCMLIKSKLKKINNWIKRESILKITSTCTVLTCVMRKCMNWKRKIFSVKSKVVEEMFCQTLKAQFLGWGRLHAMIITHLLCCNLVACMHSRMVFTWLQYLSLQKIF